MSEAKCTCGLVRNRPKHHESGCPIWEQYVRDLDGMLAYCQPRPPLLRKSLLDILGAADREGRLHVLESRPGSADRPAWITLRIDPPSYAQHQPG